MSGKRIQLDLFIPDIAWDAIPLAKKQVVITVIRELKALAVKVNAGQPDEEMTVRVVWHKCYHDEGPGHPQCGKDQDI